MFSYRCTVLLAFCQCCAFFADKTQRTKKQLTRLDISAKILVAAY